MTDLISKENNNFYHSPFKIIPLLVLEIASAFVLSFYFRQLAAGFTVPNLIWFSVGLVLFVIFSFFAALFINELLWSSLAAGFSVIAGLAVFYDSFLPALVGLGFLVFFILVWGIYRAKTELENTLKIDFFHLSKVFLSKIALAIAVLLCFFSYFLFSAKGGFPISFESFRIFVLKPNERIISIFVPNFKFQEPLQNVLAGVLENQLSQSIPNFKNLPASTKETIIASAVDQEFGVSLTKVLGYQVNLKDSVDKVVYDSLVIKFYQFSPAAKNWMYIGILVSLFFVIKLLFIPVNWLLSILIFLVYQLLLAVNFVNIKSESRSKEVIQI